VLGNALRARRRAEGRRAVHEAASARQRTQADGERTGDAASLLEVLEQQRRLTDLVADLPEPYRAAILARYFRGESAGAIARRTGANAATVRTHLARGRELLRARFGARLADGGDARRALLAAAGGGNGMALPLETATAGAAAWKGVIAVQTATKLLVAGAAGIALVGALVALDVLPSRAQEPASGRAAARLDPELRAAAPEPDAALVAAEPGGAARVPGAVGRAAPDAAVAPPADPAAEDLPALVTARVVDRRGEPLADAYLRYAEPPRPEQSPTAGDDGRVRLELPPEALIVWHGEPVPRTFCAGAPGRALAFFRASAAPAATTDLGEVELAPGGGIAGVVVDASGAPAAGAQVLAADARSSGDAAADALAGPRVGLGLPAAVSGPGGAFRVDAVEVGPARVWARVGDGLWGASEVVHIAAGAEAAGVRVALPPADGGAWIRGRVVDHAGAPLPGARVGWTEAGVYRPQEVVAGDDGAFRIRARRDVPHVLLAGGPPHAPAGFALLLGAEPGVDVELRLAARRTMRVRVLDAEGRAIGGAQASVEVEDVFLRSLYWEITRFPAEVDGAREIEVPPAPFHLAADADGFARIETESFAPESAPAELEIRLEREALVTGVVTYGREPVPGARVFLCESFEAFALLHDGSRMRFDLDMTRAETETDAGGSFELPAERSDFEIVIAVDADGFALADVGPFPAEGAGIDRLAIELVRGGTIDGALRFADGRDAAGQMIVATAGAGRIHRVRTGASGGFRLEHLRPGPWLVEHRPVEPERVWSFVRPGEDEPIDWTCTVADGAVTRVELVGLRTVSVRGLLTVDGAPAAGWSAALERFGGLVPHEVGLGGDKPSRATITGAGGAFALETGPGRQRLVLASPPGAAGEVVTLFDELALDEAETAWEAALALGRLEVRAGDADLELRLRTPVGERVAWTAFRVAAGETLTVGAPAGTGGLQRLTPDGGWRTVRDVDVRAGATASVELDEP
jgi:hypothetical protein